MIHTSKDMPLIIAGIIFAISIILLFKTLWNEFRFLRKPRIKKK